MDTNASGLPFESLARQLKGDLLTTYQWRLLYATDASVYREVPEAVCFPRDKEDLKVILEFCRDHRLPLVPRTAGTSLAGQVVGHGLVVDFSRYMTAILELDADAHWVRVQPGVILDDLNRFLEPYGLFFGPETSTSNRCMMAGMVGNNSCGAHSLVYGSTRDHTLEITALLADGSEAVFGAVDPETFRKKCIGNSLENRIYNQVYELLSNKENQQEIRDQYPDPRLHRRNTGYALDLLLETELFSDSEVPFNFCRLLAGSEGSLALFTEIKLNLVPVPPPERALVCVHLNTIEEALHANLIALEHGAVAVELIDRVILDCTRNNLAQRKNRFFLQGDPGAILVVEFATDKREEIIERTNTMEQAMRAKKLGYHFPVLTGNDMDKVWALRKAGLGLLSNIPGDAKPVAVIEDAAVHVEELPAFIKDLQAILERLRLECVYYAHIGTGELHLRPVLNLKSQADVERFYQVARDTASLVRKYRGSLSGEHGDGRLRGEFIPMMLGEKVYEMLRQVKKTWDPQNIINPGKITDTPSMKTHLRYSPGKPEPKIKTHFDYPESLGLLRGVEKCNGSGDCRKPFAAGGVMCPSYHATLNEQHTTRGRANILREFVTHSGNKNPFDHQEILDVLDLCLSCKGCKAECPSSVDMGKYKAEALQQYYDTHGVPIRARLVAAFAQLNILGSKVPAAFNFFSQNRFFASLFKKAAGFAPKRSIPRLAGTTMRSWAGKNLPDLNARLRPEGKKVILFCDEFTNFNDTEAGISTVLLLHRLGYRVEMPLHPESGRASISKGLLKKAKTFAEKNVQIFSSLVSEKTPLVGIEPSAILCFRDEYPDLMGPDHRETTTLLAANTLTIEEFLCREYDAGRIDTSEFSAEKKTVHYHAHCHQKALSSKDFGRDMMAMAPNKTIHMINCGCCGMAGSFGFEKEHYDLSMQIGELQLFPAIRNAAPEALIAASGTSCRHQILDGTGKKALHPAEVLYSFLK
jgi:FAD/FMN-containing dehydrogenase/Fe-S oxidoreductase